MSLFSSTFFFNDTATTEIYTLSLHDALPIYGRSRARDTRGSPRAPSPSPASGGAPPASGRRRAGLRCRDRKSTRLNSSHTVISYAVFCLKKKKKNKNKPVYNRDTGHIVSADV